MRKLLRMLALLLCAALLSTAMGAAEEAAETTEPAEAGAADVPPAERTEAPFDEEDAPYEGLWVPFEDGFCLYLPGEWRSFDITPEQAGAGMFYRAGNGGWDAAVGQRAMGVAVSYMPAGEARTLEALAASFEAAGYQDVAPRARGGIDAIDFTRPGDGYRGAAFFHPALPEYVLVVYVTPIGEPGDAVNREGGAILDSLRARGESAAE